ncbi:MAG TPA: VOC family protein [Polyangia bacterium]|jgi:hypothetical protein
MSNPFSYAELHSKDADQAITFYRRLFDWKVTSLDTPKGRYTELDPAEGFPGGLLAAKPGAPSGWLLYMRVDDVEAATQKARDLGATILASKELVPDTGWFSLCVDPAGAAFGLWQPMPGKK